MTKKILMTQTTQELFIEQFEQRLREALHQHREKLGLGQVRVADSLGISPSTYQRWESGQSLTDIF